MEVVNPTNGHARPHGVRYSYYDNKKINVVANARTHMVRKPTAEEYAEIESLPNWQNGYFVEEAGGQIVARQREDGQHVAFCIGH